MSLFLPFLITQAALAAEVVDRACDELVWMRPHTGIQALVGAADQAHAGHNVLVEPSVGAGPVGVLAQQAYAAWHEEFAWPR